MAADKCIINMRIHDSDKEDFKLLGKYNMQGLNQTARSFFWLYFSLMVAEGRVHSSRGKSSALLPNDVPVMTPLKVIQAMNTVKSRK